MFKILKHYFLYAFICSNKICKVFFYICTTSEVTLYIKCCQLTYIIFDVFIYIYSLCYFTKYLILNLIINFMFKFNKKYALPNLHLIKQNSVTICKCLRNMLSKLPRIFRVVAKSVYNYCFQRDSTISVIGSDQI